MDDKDVGVDGKILKDSEFAITDVKEVNVRKFVS